MRKIILFVSAFLLLVTAPTMASVTDLSKTYSYTNETAGNVTVSVSTTTIIPGIHKVLSYQIIPTNGSAQGAFAALYDASSTSVTTEGLNLSNMIGESETVVNETKDRLFPYPKPLSDGLTIIVGAKTTIMVDYCR